MESTRFTVTLICVVGFLDLLAVSMVLPLIATRVKELGASPRLGGLIGSIYGATQLLSSPVVGSWSDVRGRKTVLLFCLSTTALAYFFMGNVALLGMAVARLMAGAFKHSQSLSQAYLANMASSSDRSVYYGYFTATSNIGFIIGPTFGGHLVEMPDGFFWVTLVVSLIFMCNTVLVWWLLPDVKHTREKSLDSSGDSRHPQVVGNWKKTTNYLRSLQLERCWHVLLLRLVLAFSTLVYRSSYTLILSEKFELSGKHIGYLTSYQGVVSTVAGFLVGHFSRLDADEGRQVLYGVSALFVALVGLTVSSVVASLVASLTLLCVSTSFLRVCLTQVMISRCPKDKVGAIVGFAQSVTSTARMLSPLVGGLALEMGTQGPGTVSSVTAGAGLAIAVVLVARPVAKQKTN